MGIVHDPPGEVEAGGDLDAGNHAITTNRGYSYWHADCACGWQCSRRSTVALRRRIDAHQAAVYQRRLKQKERPQ